MVVAVATLVGTPTGGALLKTVDQKHFNGLIIFSGVMTLAGTAILAVAHAVGSPWIKRLLAREKASDVETKKQPEGENTP